MYKNQIWVPSHRYGWSLVEEVDRQDNNNVIYIDDNGNQSSIDIGSCCEYCESDTNDLTSLTHLNEANLLQSLKTRYQRKSIYTRTGSVLIAVNPFQNLNIYKLDNLDSFYNVSMEPNNDNHKIPHVYSKAGDCLEALRHNKTPQSILVSGESGSGKTQTSKYVMKFLATTSSQNKSGIEDAFLQSNPVLESFGNAKTRRNNNSSRFGKYAKVYFQENKIIGASTTTYLLEKTRFIFQEKGEGNFHFVYQLLDDLTNKEDICQLNYTYVSEHDNLAICQEPDKLQNTLTAMEKLGFQKQQLDMTIKLVRGLLVLGNLDCSVYCKQQSLKQFSEFLSLTEEDSFNTFFSKTIEVGSETISTNLTEKEVLAKCNTFSKSVYGSLFEWIVEQINIATKPPNYKIQSTIGILDIFGFEVFTTNGFEQFCINYANEKLQGLFNEQLITAQQHEYIEEGISWSQIDFTGNDKCLIELGKYFFPLIDETSRLKSGNDKIFARRLKGDVSRNLCKCLIFPKSDPPPTFTITHFAGDVEYTVNRFCERNVDRIHPSLTKLLSSSNNINVRTLVKYIPVPIVSSLAFKSVSKQFTLGLSSLIQDLRNTDIHYIRCIKPNDVDEANNFDNLRVTEQLRYSGVLEAIRVSRAGFPIRFLHGQFQKRYLLNDNPTSDSDGIKKGKSKYFLKHHSYIELEKELLTIKNNFAIILQSFVRCYISKTRYQLIISNVIRLQSHVRRLMCTRQLRYHQCAMRIQTSYRRWSCKGLYQRILSSIVVIQIYYRNYKDYLDRASSIITRCIRRSVSLENRKKRSQSAYTIQVFWRKYLITIHQNHKLLKEVRLQKEILESKLIDEENLRKKQAIDMKKTQDRLERVNRLAQEEIDLFKRESIKRLESAKLAAEKLLREMKEKKERAENEIIDIRHKTENAVKDEQVRANILEKQLMVSKNEIQQQNTNLRRTGQTKVEILSQMEDVVQENDRMRSELEFYRQVWEKKQIGNATSEKCTLQ